MGRVSDVLSLLLLSSLWGLHCGRQHESCQKHFSQRLFSVPGDVAMLKSTLLSASVFNLSAEPYDVTWYSLHSDQPISNQSGRVLVLGETLWLLNVTLADAGDYETVVRTPQQCFRQDTQLVVDPPSKCGRPRTARQQLSKDVPGRLSCPLNDESSKLRSYGVSYNITWHKGCELISDGTNRFQYRRSYLKVERAELADHGLYTCTLHFSLGGVRGRVSETINATVNGDYWFLPQIREPANDVIRAELGSNVTKRCLVFVPCEGRPYVAVDMHWQVQNIIPDDPRERIYTTPKRKVWQDGGMLIDKWLVISELKEQDLNLNYTCYVSSDRGKPGAYFTLLHKDPDVLIRVSILIGCCLLLFLLRVSVFYIFKLELVLWFRGTFPMFYSTSDEKLYDAYVAYPQRCSPGWTDEVERFALHTLPRVLEEACGYSLFIPDRDSLPGEAVMDSLEENLKSSRRIILLYTASTFSNKHCSNNNNTLLSRPWDQTDTEHHSQTSKDHLNTSKDHLNASKDHLNTSKDHLNTSKDHLNTSKDHLSTSKDHLNASKDHLNTSKDRLNTSKGHLNARKDHLNTSKDHLNTNKDHLSTSKGHLNARKDHLNTSKDHLNINKDHLNSSKDPRPSEDPTRDCYQCSDHRCDHARTQLECVTAMHRALLERSLKVILVELEELGPSDLEQLPESVRHLRQSQGAVCWWRTPGTRWRTGCMQRTGEDTETALSSCLSPDCRFWKEVRYRMPVRAKRRGPPEAAALLQLHRTHSRTQRLNAIPV